MKTKTRTITEMFDNIISKLIDGSALFSDGRVNIPAFGDAADYEMWLSVKRMFPFHFERRGKSAAPPVYFINPDLSDMIENRDLAINAIAAARALEAGIKRTWTKKAK